MHALLIFLVILVVVWVWTNLTKRRPEVPGSFKRTPRWKILAKLCCIPLMVLLFWAALFQFLGAPSNFVLAWVIGGLICLVVLLGIWWLITNVGTFLCSPRYYWMWRKGGGDPWFSTLPEPFNTDEPEVRYQELFREKARQQAEMFRPASPPPPDPTDDPTANIRI